MRKAIRSLLGLWFLLGAAGAFAHDPGLSSANLRLRPGGLEAVVTYNDRDISLVLGATAHAVRDGGPTMQVQLAALAQRALLLEGAGVTLRPLTVSNRVDQNKNVEFSYTYEWPQGVKEVTLKSALLPEMPFGHRQVLTVLDASGQEIARRLGVKPRWTTVVFESLLLGVQRDRYDLVIASHGITPERLKAVAFSEPHYCSGGVLVDDVPADPGLDRDQ